MHRAAFYGEGTQILAIAVGSWYSAPFHQLMLLCLYVYYQPLSIKFPYSNLYIYIYLTEVSLHACTEEFREVRKYELRTIYPQLFYIFSEW